MNNLQIKTGNTTISTVQQITVKSEMRREKGSKWKRFYYNNERLIYGGPSVILFLFLWEFLTWYKIVDPIFTSSPSRIWKAGIEYVTSDTFVVDVIASGSEIFFGFGLAVAIGIPLGILMGWYPKLNYIVDPFISFLYSSPRIALVPLFIIWFGIGMGSKVSIILLSSVFPIIITTFTGVKTIDPALLNVARSFSAKDHQIFSTIILPSSVPSILAGVRLGLGHALIAMVVGEMMVSTKGVGYTMITAGYSFNSDLVFVGLIIIAGLGVLLSSLIQMFQRYYEKWRIDIHK